MKRKPPIPPPPCARCNCAPAAHASHVDFGDFCECGKCASYVNPDDLVGFVQRIRLEVAARFREAERDANSADDYMIYVGNVIDELEHDANGVSLLPPVARPTRC